MRRRLLSVTVLALAVSMLPLGACSNTTQQPSSTPSPAAPSNSVCTSLSAVKSDVAAIGDGLTLDPSAGGTALEQVKAQLAADVTTVRNSVDELKAAIAAAPLNPGAQDLKATLESQSDDVVAAVQSAADAADEAANATSATAFITAAGTALTQVGTASAAARTYTTTVKTAASQAIADVKAAFADAPACQGILATP
jgi:AcrR family transcriptional regulator